MCEIASGSITVSIVSHSQGALVEKLLLDLSKCNEVSEVIVTRNIPEATIHLPGGLSPKIRKLENETPKGFAENHNAAFKFCRTKYFAVLNPDIRLTTDPFGVLMRKLEIDEGIGVIAPRVITPGGFIEDSARVFPTPMNMLLKLVKWSDGSVTKSSDAPQAVDWVGGMFMLFRSALYAALDGFDKKFFLYYEDVDICRRVWGLKNFVIYDPEVEVIHSAQRASHRNLQYMSWHLKSMLRYFLMRKQFRK